MSAVARLARPPMRDLQKRYFYKHCVIGIVVAFCGGMVYKYTWADRRFKYAEEFFKTYDPYEDFERMRNLGLFQSCPPDNK